MMQKSAQGGVGRSEGAAQHEHHEGHAKAGSAVDAQYGGVGQGVMKNGLQHKAADSQTGTAEQCRDGLRQTRLHHHETRYALAVAAQQGIYHLGSVQMDGAKEEIDHKHHDGQQYQKDKGKGCLVHCEGRLYQLESHYGGYKRGDEE